MVRRLAVLAAVALGGAGLSAAVLAQGAPSHGRPPVVCPRSPVTRLSGTLLSWDVATSRVTVRTPGGSTASFRVAGSTIVNVSMYGTLSGLMRAVQGGGVGVTAVLGGFAGGPPTVCPNPAPADVARYVTVFVRSFGPIPVSPARG